MEEHEEGLILGIDYAHEYTQISYLDSSLNKSESISTIADEQRYLIPTVLCKKNGQEEWCIGEEAIHRSSISGEMLISNFLPRVNNVQTITIENVEYTYPVLFSLYLQSLLALAKSYVNQKKINTIVYTLDNADKSTIETLITITSSLGFLKEQIKVIKYTESFAYYMLNQSKLLWTNDVILFAFHVQYFKYYRFSINRVKLPFVVSVEEEDLSSNLSMDLLDTEEGMNLADLKFMEIIKEKIKSRNICSVYLLGIGFTNQWFTQSIDVLCQNRRVFQGQNLFSIGACYSLGKHPMNIQMKDYLLLCQGRTMVDISVLIEHKGINRQLMLSKAGTNWYEAGARTECILDDIRVIQLIITSPIHKINRNISIELEGFPYRPNKTTRIELIIAYYSDTQFDVIIKDKGFGELFKTSDKVIRRSINVNHYL